MWHPKSKVFIGYLKLFTKHPIKIFFCRYARQKILDSNRGGGGRSGDAASTTLGGGPLASLRHCFQATARKALGHFKRDHAAPRASAQKAFAGGDRSLAQRHQERRQTSAACLPCAGQRPASACEGGRERHALCQRRRG